MKKLFALLLALVMVLSMTACGGGRTEPAPAATTPLHGYLPEAAAETLRTSRCIHQSPFYLP